MDEYLLQQYCEAARALEAAGLRGPQRLHFQARRGRLGRGGALGQDAPSRFADGVAACAAAVQVEEGAGHHEKAWAWRLSGALTFLLSPWWEEVGP